MMASSRSLSVFSLNACKWFERKIPERYSMSCTSTKIRLSALSLKGIDAQSLLQHLNNVRGLMDALFKTCTGSGEVCGEATPELIKTLAGSPVRLFSPYQAL